jgi:multiple sugar transport system permease protein
MTVETIIGRKKTLRTEGLAKQAYGRRSNVRRGPVSVKTQKGSRGRLLVELRTVRDRARGGWRHLPAILIAAGFLLPLVYMVTGSLRKPGLPPPRTPEFLPWPPSGRSYERAFELVDLGRYLANSILVAGITVPLTLLVASWAGFAMARLPARVSRVLIGASLVALMVPLTALLVPRFVIFKTLGLTDTYVPLIASALLGTSPFYVLLYYWSFRRLPRDLFDAARVEGLRPTAVWWRVGMPLVKPVTVAVGVLAFAFSWSNFLDPLVYLSDADKFTLPLGLRSLAQLGQQDYPVLLAGAVTATLPVIGAFLYVQQFFLGRTRNLGMLEE